ncbi:hypothetical protein SCAR479_12947 [Seiridium cardinale]|uniref:Autophagy-related protein 28 n=1 Tax=Seiridium cardinale TaxID=138064 RepID=A0ABR2X9C3_9PEZI
MASKSSFLPRLSLGGNGSPTLPMHNRRNKSNDYDLSELSPRPSSPLLSPDHVHDFGFQDSVAYSGNGNTENRSNGKGKGKAVAYAEQAEEFPPVSVVDRMRIHREKQAASGEREQQAAAEIRRARNGPSWQPPSQLEYRDDDKKVRGQQLSPRSRQSQGSNLGSSFMGFLNPAPSNADRSPVSEVDSTFRTIQRREVQIQKELQKLLDAQALALDQGGASNGASQDGNETPRGTSRASSSPYRSRSASSYEGPPAPTVVPVRQPKPKPLTIRQVRTSIARSMAMLSDLKEEEEACIASAISARKTALAKANKLSHQHKAIAADLRALETDDPLRRELEDMSNEYGRVSGDIDELEGRLRALKHRKRVLEARMEEVKSECESGLSGYKGALKETERDIGEMMRVPGVKVLPIDAASQFQQAPGPDANADETTKSDGLDRALSGHEFMRMRPERRTIAMAKEWWEGEMALLSRRKDAVDKERDALSEGAEIWAHIVQLIVDYERRLSAALNDSMQVRPDERHKLEENLFKSQHRDLQETMKEMEKTLHYVEERGWNLLVAAIGAELEGFVEGENILVGLMKAKGHELPSGASLVNLGGAKEMSGEAFPQTTGIAKKPDSHKEEDDDELTGSVVRRWGGQSETRTSPRASHVEDRDEDANSHNEPPRDLLEVHHDHKEESDNEVPADLFVSAVQADESEDDHANEVPAEFLSMHDASLKGEDRGVDDEDNEVPKDLLGEVAADVRDDAVD